MSTSGFTVTLDDAQVQAALTRLTSRLANMTPIMEDVGRALGNLTEDAFQAEGPGWPQLRPPPSSAAAVPIPSCKPEPAAWPPASPTAATRPAPGSGL
jgi:hypothetical protein